MISVERCLAALAVVLLVTGCSSRPSDEDVKRELAASVSQSMLGVPVEISNLEVGSCAAAASGPGIACSLSAMASVPITDTQRHEAALSGIYVFDKIGGDWKMVGRQQ